MVSIMTAGWQIDGPESSLGDQLSAKGAERWDDVIDY